MDKFKNTEQLEKAYKELEKEFTKKSQKVKALESEAKITYVYGSDLKEHIKVIEEKDQQIELLNKRWELLKDFIKEEIEFDKSEYEDYGAPRCRYYLDAETLILDKMKELEQE